MNEIARRIEHVGREIEKYQGVLDSLTLEASEYHKTDMLEDEARHRMRGVTFLIGQVSSDLDRMAGYREGLTKAQEIIEDAPLFVDS